eukprot:6205296-Pleurochrysis_carterae.AAC.4
MMIPKCSCHHSLAILLHDEVYVSSRKDVSVKRPAMESRTPCSAVATAATRAGPLPRRQTAASPR